MALGRKRQIFDGVIETLHFRSQIVVRFCVP
jgi:hypothetical protein